MSNRYLRKTVFKFQVIKKNFRIIHDAMILRTGKVQLVLWCAFVLFAILSKIIYGLMIIQVCYIIYFSGEYAAKIITNIFYAFFNSNFIIRDTCLSTSTTKIVE